MKLDNCNMLNRVAGVLEGLSYSVCEELKSFLLDSVEMIDTVLRSEKVEPN